MFYNQGYAGATAMRRYAAVHSGSRTEGASPHALVKILFDELLLALETAIVAERMGDRVKVSDKQARAMSILFALESSLDFDKGGDIARGLGQIYREARRLLLTAARERSVEPVDQARDMIAEIADAWGQIG
ncbi:flagellar protein FliS [Sphingobium sp. AN641]|uniref:flagellar export chaperone FliS n=1 Tax=Sphingobium sp. AN641 TaxID=3133443 RepID=UPI0030BD5B4D